MTAQTFPDLVVYYFPSDTAEQCITTHPDGTWPIGHADSGSALDCQLDFSGTISSYDEYEDQAFKERMHAGFLKSIDVLCVWDCCWCWVRVQELVALIVFDPFMELFITLCIVVNTLFMAMDHHNMDKDIDRILYNGNLVSFVAFFPLYNQFSQHFLHSFSLPFSRLKQA